MLKHDSWLVFFISFAFLLVTLYIRTDYKSSVKEETYYRVALFIGIIGSLLFYKYGIYTVRATL